MHKRINKFKDFTKADSFKKALSAVIDYTLLLIITILSIGFIAFPILENNSEFTSNRENLYFRTEQLVLIQDETKLVKKDDKATTPSLIPQNELFKIYFAKQMALSYEKAPLLYDQNNITPDQSTEVASFYNDNLAYYYSQYKHVRSIKTEDFGNLAPHMYFIKLMEESTAKDYYVFNHEDLPYIKAEAGLEIYKLINGKISSSEAFNVVYQNYLNLVNKGLEELQSYDIYLEHFESYKTSLFTLYRLEFVSLIIAFISCYLLIIIAPQYIFGNGLTLGRFIMKTRTYFASENYVFVILRQFLEFLSSILLVLVIGFFTYGVYIFLIPVGFTSVLGILSVFLTFTIINIGCSLFTNSKVLLSELLSKSITVNIKEPKYTELEVANKKEEINE